MRRILILAACASLAACVTTGAGLIQSSDKNVSLILVPVASPDTRLAPNAPAVLVMGDSGKEVPPPNSDEETVWRQCGWTPPAKPLGKRRSAFPITLVGLAVNYVFDAISKEVAAEIAKYQASFSGIATGSFYLVNNGSIQPLYSCLRFSRYETDSSGKLQVVFDLIAQFRPTTDYLQIVPLRLYYGKAKAVTAKETINGKTIQNVSLAVTLTATAFWKQGNQGLTSQLFTGTLLTLTCDFSEGAPVWYAGSILTADEAKKAQPCTSHTKAGASGKDAKVPAQSAIAGIVAPLPPYSVTTGTDGQIAGPGLLQLTATAAEVGTPPELVCKLASVLKSQQSTAESALASAIDEKLGFESSSSGSGAQKGGNGGGGQANSSSAGSGSTGGSGSSASAASTTACGSSS